MQPKSVHFCYTTAFDAAAFFSRFLFAVVPSKESCTLGQYRCTACRCFAKSRLVSYRSCIALYVVVVVSVMAAKHVSSTSVDTVFFLCRRLVKQF